MSSTAVTTRTITMADLPGLVGTRLGTSRSVVVGQDMIDLFADATGDHQWIHVDPQRAAHGPFGTTIAHGYLTLSLAVQLFWDILDVTDSGQVVNYGLNKVRFPAAVTVGARLSATADLLAVDPCAGGYQLTLRLTFQVDGVDRPVCVAESLLRYYGDADARSH